MQWLSAKHHFDAVRQRDFVHVDDNHQVQIVAKFRWSSKFRRAAVNRVFKDRRWLVPRSAAGTSVLIEHWNSGVG